MKSMEELAYLVRKTSENERSYFESIGNWEKDMKKKEEDYLSSEDLRLAAADKKKEEGNRYVKARNWGRAIKSYTEAIELNSCDPIYFANRALCYLKIGKPQLAESDCTEALSFDGKYIKALQRRGAAREYLGMNQGAIEDFRAVLKLDPDDVDAKNHLKELIGETQLATDASKARAERDKELGNECVKTKKWTEAIRCYSSAVQNDPSNAVYYANRALCYLEMNQLKLADDDCEAAILLDKTYIKAYYRRGKVLQKLNRLEEAAEWLESALKVEPTNALVKKLLAEIRAAKPIEREPSNAPVKKLLAEIRPAKPIEKESEIDSDDDSVPLPQIGAHHLQPIFKPPHKRSKVPLEKINIRDVYSFDEANAPAHNTKAPVPETKIPIKIQTTQPSIPETKTRIKIQTTQTSILETKAWDQVRNSDDFIRCWRDSGRNTEMTYSFLKTIDGPQLPIIFKESMDGLLLSEILEVLHEKFIPGKDKVAPYLLGLSQVPRFGIISLLLSTKDKEAVVDLLRYMDRNNECNQNQLSELQKAFSVHKFFNNVK